jgi:hypothetical protein
MGMVTRNELKRSVSGASRVNDLSSPDAAEQYHAAFRRRGVDL